jgi:hypothetical protein
MIDEFDEIFIDCPCNYSLQVSKYGRVKNKFTDEIMEQTIFNGCYIVNNPIKYKNLIIKHLNGCIG